MLAETYWELLRDPAHWLFEITLIIVFDVLLAGLLYPAFKSWLANHDRIHHGKDT